MRELTEVLRAAQPVVFGVLAAVAVAQLLAHRSRAAGWAAAAFAILGTVSLAGRLLDDEPDRVLARQLLVAVLVLFPYCLFRFAGCFRSAPRALEVVAAGLTTAAAATVFLFEDLPNEGEPRSAAFAAYSVLVLVQWALLSVHVATVLWRAGAGRSAVVRRRLRTLAMGAVGIVVAILVAVVAPDDADPADAATSQVAVELVAATAAVAAGPLFLVGVAPPSALLSLWRRPDVDALYEAEAALMAATTTREVAEALLPHVARTLGASTAAITGEDGAVLAAYGVAAGAAGARPDRHDGISVPLRGGELRVSGDAYTPFFGRDEVVVLARLARLTDVALRRAEMTERERAAAAELEAANEATRSFVAIASHDLRTPVATVRGFAELLRDQGGALDEEDRRTYLDAIVRQANHLSRLVSDLLTVSRLDSGTVEPAREPVPLGKVVAEVVADVAVPDVVDEVPGELVVDADPDHLARIVRNLLENARDHGEPPIEVRAARGDGHVDLVVVDHGPGVAPALEPRLFERFARADGARRGEHGTGLGLSIVRGLARAGGGDAWHFRDGASTCFAVRLPTPEERT